MLFLHEIKATYRKINDMEGLTSHMLCIPMNKRGCISALLSRAEILFLILSTFILYTPRAKYRYHGNMNEKGMTLPYKQRRDC